MSGGQRRIATRELDYYVEALGHDPQYDVQRSVRLIRLLGLPMRYSVQDALDELHRVLALTRARNHWGRPWTMRQLQRIYFLKPGKFLRASAMPVTDAELATLSKEFK